MYKQFNISIKISKKKVAVLLSRLLVVCFIVSLIFSGWIKRVYAVTETFSTGSVVYTSSDTWTVPTGVTSITVEVWGGGGAGGGNTDDEDGGGGGGGGAYSIKTGIAVTPTDEHNITVGTGGTGVSVGDGNPGNDSIFYDDDGSTVLVLAKGGSGGIVQASNAPGDGGAGGAAGSCVCDQGYSGGAGGRGRSNNTGRGGPGGGSGGTASDGNSGETTWAAVTGEDAVVGGGAGGNGGTTGAGTTPNIEWGGGGGGAGDGSGADLAGGDGADGAVRITYTYTWTAPVGVNSVQIEVWGGGGGGGGQNIIASDGGGGGGGGAYAIDTSVAVVASNTYTVVVGAGGLGGIGVAGASGGDSYFNTAGTVMAKGGSPGSPSSGTPPDGGIGGVGGSSVGETTYSGGQGEKGSDSTTGRGGYGGSSAGTAADGWSGPQTWSTVTYPTGSTPTGGGHGGNGGGSNDASGSAPASGAGGGGGGGAEATTSTRTRGGAGADGQVTITYTINSAPTLNVDEPDGTNDTVTAGDNYNIQYDLDDSDDTVTVAFYYDTDNSGLDGTAISGACATAAEGTNATCSWDTTGVTPGSYYVYGVTNDGTNPAVSDYSSGQITIDGAASLTMVVTTNTFSNLNPSNPVFATSTISIDTDNSDGWNVTLSRDDGDTTMDLNTDATINIIDQTAWSPGVATTSAGNAVRLASLSNSGDVLAFRVMTASGTAPFRAATWWGSADNYVDNANTLWAGLPTTDEEIGNSSVDSGGSAVLSTVLYYLDVATTQPTGTYSGDLTFTATVN